MRVERAAVGPAAPQFWGSAVRSKPSSTWASQSLSALSQTSTPPLEGVQASLAAVGVAGVGVVVADEAGAHDAGAVGAERARVREGADVVAGAAVERIRLCVGELVGEPVAVVVEAVADLHAAVGGVHAYSQPLATCPSRSSQPGAQVCTRQKPPVHTGKALGTAQTFPQRPQFLGSVWVSAVHGLGMNPPEPPSPVVLPPSMRPPPAPPAPVVASGPASTPPVQSQQ